MCNESLLFNDCHVKIRQCPTYKPQFTSFFLQFVVMCYLITIDLNASDHRKSNFKILFHICRARMYRNETANLHTFGPDKVYPVNVYAQFRG